MNRALVHWERRSLAQRKLCLDKSQALLSFGWPNGKEQR